MIPIRSSWSSGRFGDGLKTDPPRSPRKREAEGRARVAVTLGEDLNTMLLHSSFHRTVQLMRPDRDSSHRE